jgi:SAM-dependent methyltransferase
METLQKYDLWSSSYDRFDNPLVAMTEVALDQSDWEIAGRRVLELGCGTGRNAPRLLALGAARYLGLDGSKGMLAHARQRELDSRAEWIEADLCQPLPVDEGGFDRVLVALVLEHFAELGPLFKEIRRILSPGGSCLVLDIHPDLVRAGTQAHFWHEGSEHRLPSYPHELGDYEEALEAARLSLATARDWRVTPEAETRCPKLTKHRGKPVLLEVRAVCTPSNIP